MQDGLKKAFDIAQHASNVVIPQNWKQEIQEKIAWAEEKRELAMQHGPGESHGKLWGEYNERCKEVIAFLDQNYGGYFSVHRIMKNELGAKAAPYSIDLGEFVEWDEKPNSMPEGYEAIGAIGALNSTFENCYESTIWQLDCTIKTIIEGQPKLK